MSQITIQDFILNYCARNRLVFRDNIGYMNSCVAGIKREENLYFVRTYKVHTYFMCKGWNTKYKAITKDGYLILV